MNRYYKIGQTWVSQGENRNTNKLVYRDAEECPEGYANLWVATAPVTPSAPTPKKATKTPKTPKPNKK